MNSIQSEKFCLAEVIRGKLIILHRGQHETMSETATSPVQTNANGRVWEVTLTNPPENRLSINLLQALNAALDRFESDSNLHLLLLQGTKNCFSKGFDLSAISSGATPREMRQSLVLSNALFSRLARSEKPTVAAISGACLGGGLELVLACHYRLCSDRARLGLPEIWIKLVPGLGGVARLCRLIGEAKALEMVTLGDLIDPQEALRLNLVNRIFPRDEFVERVNGFVQALLMAEPHVLREAISLINRCHPCDEEDNVRLGMEAFGRLAREWSPPSI